MAKISFNKLGLIKEPNVNIITIGEQEIEVKTYLPIEDKMSLVELVVQESMEYGFVNPLKLEKWFNLYFIYKYTNINFPDSVRKDEDALYDILEINGVIDTVVQAAPDDYASLFEKCEEYLDKYEKYQTSMQGVLTRLVNSLPEKLSSAMEVLEELDTSKLAEVMNMTKMSGGNEEAIAVEVNGQNK